MTRLVRIALLIAVAIGFHPFVGKSVAAEASAEQLTPNSLNCRPISERSNSKTVRARRASSISFILGAVRSRAIMSLFFEKRYPFVKVEMGDIGSQDAAERFIAEETAGRHLTDILTLGVPDMAVILKQNLVAKYPTPATKGFKTVPSVHRAGESLDALVLGRTWNFLQYGFGQAGQGAKNLVRSL